MFVWPAYRLLFFALLALNVWSWRFALRKDALQLASAASRLQAELNATLTEQNEALTAAVASATRSLVVAKEEADAANKAKSQFLANVSHEIRTPLTAILGFAEMARAPGAPSEDQAEAAGVIERNGRHLLALINDVLDLSKIEAGELGVEAVELDPNEIVGAVIALLRPHAAQKGITLTASFQGETPERFVSDPTRLRQILLNLVGNAIKFTEHGSVQLICRAEGPREATQISFDVIDTGLGVPDDKLEEIFDAFTQAEASTVRRFGGTGLGLAISRALATKLGGTLDVSSELGVGSVFSLRFEARDLSGIPFRADAHERPSLAAQTLDSDASGCPGRILLAEDGTDNQRLLLHFLSAAGASVTIAENGARAVELALDAEHDTPFDLVLMDMQMPELDGYGAARRLRDAGFAQPIVALTANAMATDRDRCLSAGCNDYLTKPVDRAQLIRTCRHWIELDADQGQAA